ncbi:hypothetical protein SAMN04488134_101372 [Amphibacillus marinus]|uniref:ABC-2 type transport system permease protein n=1 Tax=Amphibacillus marinus TaxID=872970 RepID=A0A1H8HKW9_9BACI|nr:hypothetical protein [Amphibacillus marinus]SEN56665.1 hypothetical protein SAMN04488134_101372 [Amphibacillus marinus]
MALAIRKCLIIAIGLGFIESFVFFTMEGTVNWSDIILHFGFSEIEIIFVYLIELSIRLLPIILFQAFFGTYIYQRFCSASVYYFSRCPNRIRWFLKEASKLYLLAFIYPFLMVLTTIVVVPFIKTIHFDHVAVLIFIYYLLIHSMWLFITTLMINVLSIKFDSGLGFVIVTGLQITSVTLMLLWEKVWPLVDNPSVAFHSLLLKFNPIAHLILPWHSSKNADINNLINQYNLSFDLNESVLLFLLLSSMALGLGCLIIKQQEWIVLNRESGGI